MFDKLFKKEKVFVESPILLDGEGVDKDTVIAKCGKCDRDIRVLEHFHCTEEGCKVYLNCFVSHTTKREIGLNHKHIIKKK
jgi:hypothetical protein